MRQSPEDYGDFNEYLHAQYEGALARGFTHAQIQGQINELAADLHRANERQAAEMTHITVHHTRDLKTAVRNYLELGHGALVALHEAHHALHGPEHDDVDWGEPA